MKRLGLAAAALLFVSAAAAPPTARFSGSVRGGESFERSLGGSLRFVLEPEDEGWNIHVRGADTLADYAGIVTPPFHGPNPLGIQAWHFRNADNTGPNRGDPNAPQEEREFSFVTSRRDYDIARLSLDQLLWPGDRSQAAVDSATAVFDSLPKGAGTLRITAMELRDLGAGRRPRFASMRFEVELRAPAHAGFDSISRPPRGKPKTQGQ